MTLIQLIDHLKTVLEDHGGQDMEVMIYRNDGMMSYEGHLIPTCITVDPEAKTITFT